MAFLATVEHGSFTKGAEALNCSKSYLSKQVSQLEKALGVQLLFRTTRRVTLTEAGQTYLNYCRKLKQTLEEAERTVSCLRQEISGLVRLTVPTTFGSIYMADLLLAFRERYPAVEIDLDLSREQRDLIAGGFDVAIRSSSTLDERLIAKPLGTRNDWLVASPATVQRWGAPAAPQDLTDKPCIANHHATGDIKWLFEGESGQHEVMVKSWLNINDYPLILRVVLADGGFAKLPRYLVEPDVVSGKLLRVLNNYELPQYPLFLVFPQRLPQPPKVRALIDFIDTWFNPPPSQL